MTVYYTPKTGQFNSDLSKAAVIAGLQNLANCNSFAASLFQQSSRWSQSQEAWAHRLVLDAQKAAAKAPVATQNSGPTYSRIVAMFAKASGTLKYPRITFRTPTGTVRLQRAGENSRYVGQIMVTDGEAYGQNRYYGRIDQNGVFQPGRDANPEVTAVLAEIDANPAEALDRMGRAEGCCCFCGKDLVAEDSTVWGYGPVCAKHWGLPHGVAKISIVH